MGDQDEDLPLSANFKQIRIEHYNLEMTCNFDQHTFDSTLVLSITSGPEWNGETDLVLDCSDIEVQDIRTPTNVNVTQEAASEGLLNFSLTKWALTINLPASDSFKERLGSGQVILVVITYRTVPKSRSLHWRQNCDGSLCVYTAAASINNRGLFPCQVTTGVCQVRRIQFLPQDVPGAMSTWSAVITLTDKFTDHVVLCTGERVPYTTSEGDLRKHHFCHKSFVVPMSTFAIAVGLWKVKAIECTHPVTRLIGEDQSTSHKYTCLYSLSLGPKALVEKCFPFVSSYISHCLSAAQSLLGTYPLPRQDIVIVHRSFSGLGLASPHLMFLSPRWVCCVQ